MNKRRLRGNPASLVTRPFVLGVTGGIASGKTTVMRLLAGSGIPAASADDLAHQCVRKGRPAYRAIVRAFGSEILGPQKEINRKALGRIVFADTGARRRLEKIVHPCVRTALQRFVARQKTLVALDIPLLYEAGYERFVDRVVVVHCSRARQIERLRSRDGLARQDALRRIAAQMPLAAKCRRADFVIHNDRTPGQLRREVKELLSRIIPISARNPSSEEGGHASLRSRR